MYRYFVNKNTHQLVAIREDNEKEIKKFENDSHYEQHFIFA